MALGRWNIRSQCTYIFIIIIFQEQKNKKNKKYFLAKLSTRNGRDWEEEKIQCSWLVNTIYTTDQKVTDEIYCRVSPNEVNILACGLWLKSHIYVESTRSQHSVPIPQKTKPKQTLRHLNCLVQNNKINQHCYITVMSVFLGSLTLEIPGNSSGKHTYCNSISFDTDCGKAKYMHYNILRQNFLPL